MSETLREVMVEIIQADIDGQSTRSSPWDLAVTRLLKPDYHSVIDDRSIAIWDHRVWKKVYHARTSNYLADYIWYFWKYPSSGTFKILLPESVLM